MGMVVLKGGDRGGTEGGEGGEGDGNRVVGRVARDKAGSTRLK